MCACASLESWQAPHTTDQRWTGTSCWVGCARGRGSFQASLPWHLTQFAGPAGCEGNTTSLKFVTPKLFGYEPEPKPTTSYEAAFARCSPMWILCSIVRKLTVTPVVSGAFAATYCGRSSDPAAPWQSTHDSKPRLPFPWNASSWWQLKQLEPLAMTS